MSEQEVQHVIREVKGLYGFRYKDQDKITLCSREAMPEGIGEWLFLFMSKLLNSEQKEELLEVFKENVENIKMVRPETSITDDDRKYLEVEPYSDEQNRYSDKQHEFLGSGYYGMKLITSISFDDIVDGINLLDFL